jgi:hypothetical protein
MMSSAWLARVSRDCIWVTLSDGSLPGVPLAWPARLMFRTGERREACQDATARTVFATVLTITERPAPPGAQFK